MAAPIGLGLLFLTGVGPLISWRKASGRELRRRFGAPLVVAVIAIIPAVYVAQDGGHWWAALAIILGAFTVACIVGEYWRGMRVRHQLGGISWPGAFGTYWWADPREQLVAVWMASTPAPAQRAKYRFVINSLVNQAIVD